MCRTLFDKERKMDKLVEVLRDYAKSEAMTFRVFAPTEQCPGTCVYLSKDGQTQAIVIHKLGAEVV